MKNLNMTLDTEAIRSRAEALAALHKRWDVGAVSCVRVCNAAPDVAADVLTLLAELERVTAERDAARELLLDAFWQLGPNFLDDGRTLHPAGNVSTIHALYDYLGGWDGVKRE